MSRSWATRDRTSRLATYVVFGVGADRAAFEDVEDAELAQDGRRELADRQVDDLAARAAREAEQFGPGGLGGHVHDRARSRVVDRGVEKTLGFGLGVIEEGVLEDVEHTTRRVGHEKAAVLRAPDLRTHQVRVGRRRVERHVALFLVLALPGDRPRVTILPVLVEDDAHRADVTGCRLLLAYVHATVVHHVPDRLAQIDSVAEAREERRDPRALGREQALSPLPQLCAVGLDA